MLWIGYAFGALGLLLIFLVLLMFFGHILIGSDQVKAGMLLGKEFDQNQ